MKMLKKIIMAINPLTALFNPLERLINEHGSATILRDHVALFKDQLAILKEKFSILESENETLKAENENLKTQIEEIMRDKNIEGDLCPYCRQPRGQLMELKPHKIFGDVGVKVGFYNCTNCEKQYDKDHEP